ncbi:hypothetical protein K491DRAFT_693524 [Lophiostoma macrostomum CBS 122681]|uniref:Heterokaryon incompatibility domain-containing protein n=1 Tax=Lophiostoma macrostomum CBS 122681 TaxID=1314788 RepID=A0A6A6T703_9PLEO|nr:hypothetical protein K491DRAFT_693524 [Lophiostoma macrostomum CBS 122681]
MDHFETYNPSALVPFQIPYYLTSHSSCPEFQDNIKDMRSFLAYPVTICSLNTDAEILRWLLDHEDKAGAFVQHWLYFGFLEAVFGVQYIVISRKNLVRRDMDGRLFIDSTNLPTMMLLWGLAETTKHDKRVEERQKEVKTIITHELHMLRLLREQLPVLFGKQFDNLLMSLGAIVHTVTASIKDAWRVAFTGFGPDSGGIGDVDIDFEASGPLVTKGWCPHDVAHLKTLDIQTQYYCKTMDVPVGYLSHAQCTKDACVAMNIDERKYKSKHVQEDCKCMHLEMPTQKLHELVKAMKVPLARYVGGRLEVVEAQDAVRNVAISHVWADGLGNTDGKNSLPKCQITRLQKLCNELYGVNASDSPVAFYIDTLCVPRDLSYRQLAIQKMRDVYMAAKKVLVLDRGIESISNKISDLTKISAGIVYSGWMKRLWTYQEGALNTASLCFQLADSRVTLREFSDRRFSFSQNTHDMTLVAGLTLWLRIRDPEEMPPALAVISLCDALRWRTTSRLEDEAVCIAILLGKDPEKVLKAPKNERMIVLYDMLGTIPKPFLTLSGDRLSQKGYRWAPRSLLGSKNTHWLWEQRIWYRQVLALHAAGKDPGSDMTAKLMPNDGLHVVAPGFQVIAKLPKNTVAIGPNFWIFQITNTDEYGRGEEPIVNTQEAHSVDFGEDVDGMPETLHGYDKAWIVLVGDPDRNFEVGDTYSATAGILVVPDVTDAQQQDSSFRCRYYCRVTVRRQAQFRSFQIAEQWLNNLEHPVLAGIRLQKMSWVIF